MLYYKGPPLESPPAVFLFEKRNSWRRGYIENQCEEDEMEQSLSVHGHKLAALKLNEKTEGRPVVLLHGITHSIQVWSTDQVFRDFGPCYALSLPAHYPAVAPAEFFKSPLTAEKMARPLAEAIRQLAGHQPVLLAGHSTGGFSALAVAALYPELVIGVISLAGFAHGRWIGLYRLYQDNARGGPVRRWSFRTLGKLTQGSRALLKLAFWPGVANVRSLKTYPYFEQLVDNIFPYLQNLDIQAMLYFFREFPDVDITSLLANIKAPALVITGDKDAIVSPTQATHIAQQIPNAQLVVIKNAGHMIYMDQPDEYDRTLREWLTLQKQHLPQ